jgi:hypothetical protein
MPVYSPSPDREDASVAQAATLSSLYSFLALTMRYPDPAFCNDSFFDALESLLASLEWQPELAEVCSWRQQTIDPLDDLRTAYTRLFITSTPRATIPPYASVYMDGDGTIYGRPLNESGIFIVSGALTWPMRPSPPIISGFNSIFWPHWPVKPGWTTKNFSSKPSFGPGLSGFRKKAYKKLGILFIRCRYS